MKKWKLYSGLAVCLILVGLGWAYHYRAVSLRAISLDVYEASIRGYGPSGIIFLQINGRDAPSDLLARFANSPISLRSGSRAKGFVKCLSYDSTTDLKTGETGEVLKLGRVSCGLLVGLPGDSGLCGIPCGDIHVGNGNIGTKADEGYKFQNGRWESQGASVAM